MKDLTEQQPPTPYRENPFFHRGAIRDPAYFFGRRREARLLLELVRNGQSVSILGQRRIGKTSFLFYISHPDTLQAHGLSTAEYTFVYTDCQGRGGLSQGDYYRLLLRGLTGGLGEREPGSDLLAHKGESFAAFEEGILRALALGRRPVFLLDEFEAMATNRNLGPDFFSNLRRIATEHTVAYVTVTKSPLLALTFSDRAVLSSPFFNIFQPLRLGLFSSQESVEMLQGLAAKADVVFPSELVGFILDLAGPHPLLLQLAGFYAFEALEAWDGLLDSDDYAMIRERFWATAVQHFEYYWNHLDDEARYTLVTLPLAQKSAAREMLTSLEEQCLIVRREKGYDYLSSAFRDFVRGKDVPRLLQVGRFVVDQSRRGVIVDGRPLDLTKTQYALFVHLLERAGQVVTYEELEENVWGDAFTGDPERLKAAVKHLRRALGDAAAHIANVRGVGYMFKPHGHE